MIVSVTTVEDGRRAAALLADAFEEDPVLAWLLPDARNTKAARRRLFDQSVRIFMRDGLVEMTEDGHSAAVWGRPHPQKRSRLIRAIDTARGALASLVAAGSAANRATKLYETLRAHHPQEPHWYLAAIGTLRDGRGQGGASKLLAARLEVCDGEGVEAYLESSSPNNLPLYERHGFEILRQINVGNSPPLWLMTRPPHRPRFD